MDGGKNSKAKAAWAALAVAVTAIVAINVIVYGRFALLPGLIVAVWVASRARES